MPGMLCIILISSMAGEVRLPEYVLLLIDLQ